MADPVWLYVDNERKQQGPISQARLIELLNAKAISSSTLVWKSDMTEWKALSAVVPQATSSADERSDSSSIATAAAGDNAKAPHPVPQTDMYYYVDAGGAQQGPVAASAFSSLLAAGYVQPTSLVWAPGMASWSPAAAVPALQDATAAATASATTAPVVAPSTGGGAAGAAEEVEAADADGGPPSASAQGASTAATGAGAGAGSKRKRGADREAQAAARNTSVYVTGMLASLFTRGEVINNVSVCRAAT
jgi:hypothetical protein